MSPWLPWFYHYIIGGVEAGRARLPEGLMGELSAREGDLRWWLGGLRSIRLKAGPAAGDSKVALAQEDFDHAGLLVGKKVRVEKLM